MSIHLRAADSYLVSSFADHYISAGRYDQPPPIRERGLASLTARPQPVPLTRSSPIPRRAIEDSGKPTKRREGATASK